MKIRHGIIISITLFIGIIILDEMYLPIDFRLNQLLIKILTILWLVSLGLIAYLIVRSVFRAIKGTVTKAAQNKEAQKQSTTPPWEQ